MRGFLLSVAVMIGSLCLSNGALFAQSQVTSVDVPAEAQADHPFRFDFTQLPAQALLAWYMWHNISRAIPDMISKHSEQVTTIIAKHSEQTKSVQDQFLSELGTTRKAFQDQINALQQTTHTDAMAVTSSIGELAKALAVLQERIKG